MVLISTLLLWLPFLLGVGQWVGIPIVSNDFSYVYRHFDGLFYIVVAKSLYSVEAIASLRVETVLPPSYFAAHFPLYPLLIRLVAPVAGYLKSMIIVNIFFSIIAGCFFYYFLKFFNLTKKPLLLTSIFLFFPRFLVVRSVGAPESMFIFLVLASIYFFEKKKYLWAGLLGGLSVATRSPGILLFATYSLVFLEEFLRTRKLRLSWAGIMLIPLGLGSVFILYAFQYGDFWAYFNSGDNVHLAYPFAAFNFDAAWVHTVWLEEILFYFFIYLVAIVKLKDSPHRSFFYFSMVYFIAVVMVQHQDVGRYALPLWPFAVIAYEDFLTNPKYRLVFGILLVAVYFYAWNFMIHNVMPVSDWSAFL